MVSLGTYIVSSSDIIYTKNIYRSRTITSGFPAVHLLLGSPADNSRILSSSSAEIIVLNVVFHYQFMLSKAKKENSCTHVYTVLRAEPRSEHFVRIILRRSAVVK